MTINFAVCRCIAKYESGEETDFFRIRRVAREYFPSRFSPGFLSNNREFFANLKKKYFYRREYATISETERDLLFYIGIFASAKDFAAD